MTYITKYCDWEYKPGVTCGKALTEKIYNYSIDNFKRSLCFGHQFQYLEKNKFKLRDRVFGPATGSNS